ncbi:MAG: pilin [Candidatus Paceibacteria bacterium]
MGRKILPQLIKLSISGMVLLRAIPIYAAPPGDFDIPNPLRFGTIPEILGAISEFLIWIAAPILTVMVLWAGFLYLTSGGDISKIQRAKNALLWAGIGFAIILINRGVALIIQEILGGGRL